MNIHWLQESMKMKQPVNEEDYIFNFKKTSQPISVPEPPSPASKRNIQSMNSTFKKPVIPKLNFDDEPVLLKENVEPLIDNSEGIVAQYLSANTSNFAANNPQSEPKNPTIEPQEQCQVEETNAGGESGFPSTEMFNNLTFCSYGFDSDKTVAILLDLEDCGATLVDFKYSSKFDYLLCPFTLEEEIPKCKAKQFVNEGWLDECIGKDCVVPVEYYHEPVIIKEKCLQGEVIVISTYSENERLFIKNLSVGLGAVCPDAFNKKDRAILICPLPEGTKFDAAVRWSEYLFNFFLRY